MADAKMKQLEEENQRLTKEVERLKKGREDVNTSKGKAGPEASDTEGTPLNGGGKEDKNGSDPTCCIVVSCIICCILVVVGVMIYFRLYGNSCDSSAQPPSSFSVLQWNPGISCTTAVAECESNVEDRLNELLSKRQVQFANVVNYDIMSYTVPEGWKHISSACKEEQITLFYDETVWEAIGEEQAHCFDSSSGYTTKASEFIIQQFRSKQGCFEMQVFAASFQEDSGNSAVKENTLLYDPAPKILQENIEAGGSGSVLVIAEMSATVSSSDVMCGLGLPNCVNTATSSMLNTCCNPVYKLAYDRVFTNFGSVSSQLLFDPAPSWAKKAELFHKALIGTVYISGDEGTTLPTIWTGTASPETGTTASPTTAAATATTAAAATATTAAATTATTAAPTAATEATTTAVTV